MQARERSLVLKATNALLAFMLPAATSHHGRFSKLRGKLKSNPPRLGLLLAFAFGESQFRMLLNQLSLSLGAIFSP